MKASDDPMLTPSSSPRKMMSPKSSKKTSDKTSADCHGISSAVTIRPPLSPTTCSTEEKGLMEFVERGIIKDSSNAGVPYPCEDIICAFSSPFCFRSTSGAFIPDVSMQKYWCNFCCFTSKEKQEMINHSRSHRFKCNYCDQESFTRADVVKHAIRTHPEYKRTQHALKACMLLQDVPEQDETSILSLGGLNLNNDEKTDSSLHLQYDQVRKAAAANVGETPTSKRKAAAQYVDSSADPDYEAGRGKSERFGLRTKKKKVDIPKPNPQKDETAEKKCLGLCLESLPIGALVWRCGYCRFRSLKKMKVEGHLREEHSLETMKYTTMILNSRRELVEGSEDERKDGGGGGDDDETKDHYACMFCKYKSATLQDIRQHMFSLHTREKFCCIDSIRKESGEKNCYTFFCFKAKCNFQSVLPQLYLEHVKKCTPIKMHKTGKDETSKPSGLQQTVTFAQNLIEPKKDRDKETPSTSSKKDQDSSSGENRVYECLYCKSFSSTSTSLLDLKQHSQSVHPEEAVIVRDCAAASERIYVCNSTACLFNTLDYKEYLTHTIAHRGGILYGCADCNWFADDQRYFNYHVERQKGVKHSLVETRVIMKEDGSIIKESS